MCKYALSILLATIFQEHITFDQVSGKHRGEIPSEAKSNSIMLWQWCSHEVSLAGPLTNLQTEMCPWPGLCGSLHVLTQIPTPPLLLCPAQTQIVPQRWHQHSPAELLELKCWEINRPGITYAWNRQVTARRVFPNYESFALDGEKKHSSAWSNH